MIIIKGVATRNRKNPRSRGGISSTVNFTATKDPAQMRLMSIKRDDVNRLFLVIFTKYR